jgi:hypothetical protein
MLKTLAAVGAVLTVWLDVPAPPKIEPAWATAAASNAPEERLCRITSTVDHGNCQDGDIVKIGGMDAGEVPDAVQKYCDFDSQILTLPDTVPGTGNRQYDVLCRFHQREAPKK